MKVEMTQLYLCEEPYWSKYDQSDLYDHPIEINVISDGEYIMSVLMSTMCCLIEFRCIIYSDWETPIALFYQNN